MEAKSCGCPRIDPAQWHEKILSWKGKCFFAKQVNFFFGAQLGMDLRTREAAEEIERRGYVMEDPAVILVQPGLFRGLVLIGIAAPDEKSPEVRVFDDSPMASVVLSSAEPSTAPGFRLLRRFVASQKRSCTERFIWYTTCPTCLALEKRYTTVFLARLR
jgi:hypothetical protein